MPITGGLLVELELAADGDRFQTPCVPPDSSPDREAYTTCSFVAFLSPPKNQPSAVLVHVSPARSWHESRSRDPENCPGPAPLVMGDGVSAARVDILLPAGCSGTSVPDRRLPPVPDLAPASCLGTAQGAGGARLDAPVVPPMAWVASSCALLFLLGILLGRLSRSSSLRQQASHGMRTGSHCQHKHVSKASLPSHPCCHLKRSPARRSPHPPAPARPRPHQQRRGTSRFQVRTCALPRG